MRRWFTLLLLALLPLQFSWAAVGLYCGHDNSAQDRQHLGHHEHRHAGQADANSDIAAGDQGGETGFELDCGQCQGNGASLPTPLDGMGLLTLGSRPLEPGPGALRTIAQSPPERPQWARLA